MAETTTSVWPDRERAMSDITHDVKERVTQARSELQGVDRKFRQFAKERPFVVAFGAITTGYLLGRLFSRR